jgi:HEAT repeat protein
MNATRMTIPAGLLALALGVASAASAAPAQPSERLMLLLNLIDQVPTRADLVAAGVGEDGAALLAVAKDGALKRYPRARAAGLLALFDAPAARQGLASLVDDPAVKDREVRIQALAALVHLEGPAAFPRLSSLSRDPDPELRAAALRNLGRLHHPEKQALLHARLAEGGEAVPWIRDLARRLLDAR